MDVLFVFPTQLFRSNENELLNEVNKIYIIEEPTYFTKLKFHKQKLILHRASMKYYFDYLKKKDFNVQYIEFKRINDGFYKNIRNNIKSLKIYDPVDHDLLDKMKKIYSDKLIIYDTPSFIESYEILKEYNKLIKENRYNHSHFYKWQRKRMNIFMNGDKPLFDLWSFDKFNRSPFSKQYIEKNKNPQLQNNEYIEEAIKYVEKYFSNNFGNTQNFIYPIRHIDADKLLNDFINNKLKTFGIFEDAIHEDIIIGSHSMLSGLLNIGLLTPKYVLDKLLKKFNKLNKSEQKKIYPSIEGFVRQIIGWRSYVRLIYEFHGNEIMKMNRLKHNYSVSNKWYDGTTGLTPVDHMIKKAKDYAYLHHIERLMIMGNAFFLTRSDPYEVYKWFMITTIDSYDWVMIPNIWGMSQFALENIIMMKRPYFSSSNYIKKMSSGSNWNNEHEWAKIFDALYYSFINDNQKLLKSIYATANSVNIWNKKSNNEKKDLLIIAKKFIKSL